MFMANITRLQLIHKCSKFWMYLFTPLKFSTSEKNDLENWKVFITDAWQLLQAEKKFIFLTTNKMFKVYVFALLHTFRGLYFIPDKR